MLKFLQRKHRQKHKLVPDPDEADKTVDLMHRSLKNKGENLQQQ